MSGWTTGSQSQSGYSSAELSRMQREAEARVLEMQERSRRVLEDGPRYPDFVKKPQPQRAYTETTPRGMPQEPATQGQSAFGAAQGLSAAGQDAGAGRGGMGAAHDGMSAGRGGMSAAHGNMGAGRSSGGASAGRGAAHSGMGTDAGRSSGGANAGRGNMGASAAHDGASAGRGGMGAGAAHGGASAGRGGMGAGAAHGGAHDGHVGQAASWDGANAALPTPKAQTLPHHPIPEPEEKRGGLLGMLSGSLGGLLKGGGDGPISRVMDALGIDNDKIIVLMLLLILLNNNADKKLILALCYILL